MSSDNVFIVVPAFNEEGTIYEVVRSISSFGRVLVVDDASSDRTFQLATKAGAQVIRHNENLGYSSALNSAFSAAAEAGAEYIVTYDADGQHDVTNLEEIIDQLKMGADLVAGIRPSLPRLSERLFALTFNEMYGIKDPLCGLKGYRAHLYRTAGFFDRCNSYGSDLLRFACAAKGKYRIEVIPVEIHAREDVPRVGNRVRANLKIFMGMMRLYGNALKGELLQ